MKFNYSNKRLLTLFLIRFLPSLVFWYFALLWGEIFWIITILMWLEAIVETVWWQRRGYLTVDENQIQKHLLFLTDKLNADEVDEVFAYGNEWTFTPKNKKIEIKLMKNYVAPAQQKQLDEMLNRFWDNVRNSRN
ncbi:MAG: hypothetical protein H3C39_06870 [Flavobacteriia bacterium]|nr:hypothetical protein [Flavobacteriia bacterium]